MAELIFSGDSGSICGSLTRDNLIPLLAELPRLLACAEIDLGQVEQIDSAGVAFLAQLATSPRPSAPLRFVNVPSQARRLVTLYGLDEVLPFQPGC